ncbi:hypothetical protein [Amycolatopsis thermoflava]|uniref:hypothetical protein n=1 Tax=Amycolatopsis thermoflava TaxID=84480 RepID=UPI0004224DE3|nr:hypothetical protein [Amycolatopsis thermoflava]
MSETPPATLLRQAAARIRELAAGAQNGPWTYNDQLDHIHTANDAFVTHVGACHWADARWIAAMGPQLAENFAALIEVTAERVEDGYTTNDYPHALAITRLVLAQSASTDKDHDG